MSTGIPFYQFQRNSPFYSMITNYQIILLAFKEFGAAGVALRLQDYTDAEYQRELATARIYGNAELIERLKSASIRELHPPLELVSDFQNHRIKIDALSVMRELGNNTEHLVDDLKLSAMSALLVHAYERTKDICNSDSLWEFLLHCRNAGAHGGRFTFRKDQPKHPAIWGKYTLSRTTHEGMPLVQYRGEAGLFAPGDPIRLLWDIEQKYIVPTL